MTRYLFRNVKLLDPAQDELLGGHEVLVEGEVIREVSDRAIQAGGATVIDGGGRTLMPGLIDCHVHVFLSELNIRNLEHVPLTLMTAWAAELMRGMIDRGFTTVRDTGGADWGIKTAVERGLLAGPRLFISGRAIGPTGGHSDSRRRTDGGASCGCCNAMVFTMSLADGPDEVRRSAREQMRQGADQVKIMMSGGVASPYDPLDSLQYSPAEVAAVVEEAQAFGRYVCAHAYTPEAITRAMQGGVRTIEHGSLIDEPAARLMAQKGAFLVANLVTYHAMKERAAQFGMSADMLAKNDRRARGLRQRSSRPAAGGAKPRVPHPGRGDEAHRGHPVRHHRGRPRAPPRGYAGRDRARGIGRPPPGGRQSPVGPGSLPEAGGAPHRHHERRSVSQEPSVLREKLRVDGRA